MADIEATLGYSFRDPTYLAHALTHSSRKNDLQYSNERLEFLGDALLGAVISEHLYREFTDYAEGYLTRIKSAVVSRTSLARVAKVLNLSCHMIVAKGVARVPHNIATENDAASAAVELPEKKLPNSLLSNALEAIIAAVYLDGGFATVQEFILRHMQPELERAQEHAHAHNFKSALQQWAQREMGVSPFYEVVAEEGPDHVKSFEVVAVLGEKRYAAGRGATKKEAEQQAAERTFAMIKKHSEPQDS